MRNLAKFIFFKILGWNIVGRFDKEVKKCMVIVAPHTSWYDFLIGVLVRKIINLQVNFVGKKELFNPPIGWYFKWMGGAALDRSPGQQKVDAIAEIFREKEIFRLALSPEGTRKKTKKWKTGFYYIALKANVPIILVAFDYKSKTVKISEAFHPTNNFEKDFIEIIKFYDGVQGKIPENF